MWNRRITSTITITTIYKLVTSVQSWIPSQSISNIRKLLIYEPTINDYNQKIYNFHHLKATLSDRQIQFWEDVDKGLHDLTEHHGFDLSRVFQFGRR